MITYGSYSRSLPQKVILVVLELVILYVSYLILFKGLGNDVLKMLGLPLKSVNHLRCSIIFTLNVILFLAYLPTIFVFVRRKISWQEAVSLPIAFSVYYLGFSLLGYYVPKATNWVDWFGVVLFILGVSLHFTAELQRFMFKKDSHNKGKLLTTGLWRLSRHVNYFADLLWVTGFAMVTRNWWSVLIVAFLFVFFYFFNIPLQEKHLAQKYGSQFQEYKSKTKALIPFIL